MAEPRVLLLTPTFPPARGGIELLLGRLAGEWAGRPLRVVTLGRADGGDDGRVIRVPSRRRLGHRADVLRLNAVAIAEGLRHPPDVVVCGHIAVAPAAAVLSRALGAPVIQLVHALEAADRPRLARRAVARAAATVVVSSYGERLLHRVGAAARRMERIPPGVDIPAGAGASRRASRLTLVTVSRLSERYKGHDAVIRALPLIRSRVPDVEWVVVGDGPLRPLYEEMCRGLGVEGSVRFTGEVGDEVRDSLLARAHVAVMPSRLTPCGGGEGFGIFYLEAAARSLPVVAGNVGGALDAVTDGVTGVLVDPTDHVALAEAVTDLLGDGGRREAMGRAGAALAREHSWAAMAGRLGEVVDDVAMSRRRRRAGGLPVSLPVAPRR